MLTSVPDASVKESNIVVFAIEKFKKYNFQLKIHFISKKLKTSFFDFLNQRAEDNNID